MSRISERHDTPPNRSTNLLVLTFLDVSRHTRSLRNIRLLGLKHHVVAVGYGLVPDASAKYISLSRGVGDGQRPNVRFGKLSRFTMALFSLFGLPFLAYWVGHPGVRELLKRKDEVGSFDAILCNAIEPLPLALKLANGKPVFLDLHDYPLSHFEPGSRARLVLQPLKEWLYNRHVGRAAGVFCPSPSLQEIVQADFPHVPNEIVLNAPVYDALSPSSSSSENIRLVHHGNAVASRGVRNMVEALAGLPDQYSLTFVFEEPAPSWLKNHIQKFNLQRRVHLLDPVPPEEIPSLLVQFDVAIIWTQPTTLNNKMVLPGKFFESVHAGLAIVCSPTADLAAVVREKSLGVVGEGYSSEALLEALASLDQEKIPHFKANSATAARYFDGNVEVGKISAHINSVSGSNHQ